jgi:hypothetical protein
MEFYDIGMIFYGYGKGCNRTLGIKPNPGVALQIDPLTELQVSRFVCDSMIGIDLRKHCELFDERLKFTYFKEYVARLATNKIIPFNGFFIDVEDSWKYFTETAVHISKAEMEQNSILFRQEQQILQNENIQNNIDNKIDNFIQFVYEVQSKKRGLTLDSIDTPALELQQ